VQPHRKGSTAESRHVAAAQPSKLVSAVLVLLTALIRGAGVIAA